MTPLLNSSKSELTFQVWYQHFIVSTKTVENGRSWAKTPRHQFWTIFAV